MAHESIDGFSRRGHESVVDHKTLGVPACVLAAACVVASCSFGRAQGFGSYDGGASFDVAVPIVDAFDGGARQASAPPPPISGGTLLAVEGLDGSDVLVVADPDDDMIDVVSLATPPFLMGSISLHDGDRPGRVVADAGGRVHVVLRGGGAVVTLQISNGLSVVDRRTVCNSPRGIDYDAANDRLVVACATGEIVVLPASGGPVTGTFEVERDLRDVVVDGASIYVTKFRAAQILELDPTTFAVTNRTSLTVPNGFFNGQAEVAWRAVKLPKGGVQVLYQVASTNPININPNCNPYSSVSVVAVATQSFASGQLSNPVLLQSNPIVDITATSSGFATISIDGRFEGVPGKLGAYDDGSTTGTPDELVAIASLGDTLAVQRRGARPAVLIGPTEVALPQRRSHVDTGFDIFHIPTQGRIACMNCHPEGGEDSHTWQFFDNNSVSQESTKRRTQSLGGGQFSASAPYHWLGDRHSLADVMTDVYVGRMGGLPTSPQQQEALGRFLDALPRVPVKANLDPLRVENGRALFHAHGCITCHANETSTLLYNRSIGKKDEQGNEMQTQVPMLLGVADRAPYMHDGCAATLTDRFTNVACAGSMHGDTASLSAPDIDDMVVFLESL